MYVRPETFAMQMRFLAENCNVISIDALTSAIAKNEQLPSSTAVITFDDGWLDNYEYALPILKEYNLPATIFLATAYIGNKEYFWTDRVAHAITMLHATPEFSGRAVELMRAKFPTYTEILRLIKEMTSIHALSLSQLDSLIENIKALPSAQKSSVVAELHNLAKEFTRMRSERLFLNWDEVQEMAKNKVTFGSHSHQHARLIDLNAAQLDDDIVNSFQTLRSQNITPVQTFCYPGGYYNQNTQKALKDRGVKFAALAENKTFPSEQPILLGRTNIHEDMTCTSALFTARVWGPKFLQ